MKAEDAAIPARTGPIPSRIPLLDPKIILIS